MTTKSSNIFLGFNSHLLKEQKTLNTIPVAAGVRLQPRACLEFREPFPRMNKRSGHHFCSPELLHGQCRIAGLVVSTSYSLCWDQPLPPLHLRGSRDNFSVCTVTKMLPLGRTESQHPPKALENLSRHTFREILPWSCSFKAQNGSPKISKRDRNPKNSHLPQRSWQLTAGRPMIALLFFHFCSSGSQKDCVQSCFWQSFVHF